MKFDIGGGVGLSRKSVDRFQRWLKSGKHVGHFQEDRCIFYCCRLHKFATKHFCATLGTAVLLQITCISTIHTERAVAFAMQQWLWERAKMLCYSYIACLSVWVIYQSVKSTCWVKVCWAWYSFVCYTWSTIRNKIRNVNVTNDDRWQTRPW
jgi:hypothetical protein